MNSQNPASPVPAHSAIADTGRPLCGSDICTACPKSTVDGDRVTVNIDSSKILTGSLTAATILPGILRVTPPEPELTVKQAAKAYRKANRAYEAAREAHKAAEQAERDARRALGAASVAASEARDALQKAASR